MCFSFCALISLTRSQNLRDGAAADDHIAVVQHDSLAGGQSPLGCIEYDPGSACRFRINDSGLGLLIVAGLGCDMQGLRQLGEGEPIPIFCN